MWILIIDPVILYLYSEALKVLFGSFRRSVYGGVRQHDIGQINGTILGREILSLAKIKIKK